MSLGSHHSALEIYERLQLWEDIITCYQATGRKGRAEEIVREKLQEKETPTMLCLLGDLTNDPQHYRRAWEVSNNHSARAQRALGLYHLRREEYHECIESLQLSLKVNAMQVGVTAVSVMVLSLGPGAHYPHLAIVSPLFRLVSLQKSIQNEYMCT